MLNSGYRFEIAKMKRGFSPGKIIDLTQDSPPPSKRKKDLPHLNNAAHGTWNHRHLCSIYYLCKWSHFYFIPMLYLKKMISMVVFVLVLAAETEN